MRFATAARKAISLLLSVALLTAGLPLASHADLSSFNWAQTPVTASQLNGSLERASAQASAPFDLSKKNAPSITARHRKSLRVPKAPHAKEAEPKDAPLPPSGQGAPVTVRGLASDASGAPVAGLPRLMGPANSNGSNGSYLKGLLGGLLGLIFAPIAFAIETIQAVALTPVRMVEDFAKGDWKGALEPLRTVKNVVQDAVMTAMGMVNSATAPIWNAIMPSERTDFAYANNRMIFVGGPVGGLMQLPGFCYGMSSASAFTPSWHTVFVNGVSAPSEYNDHDSILSHEYVHSVQWENSFFWEKIGEPYFNDPDWAPQDAHQYVNL
jgi:hypothetical protein